MTIGDDRNQHRFQNWQLCGVWKLPVCCHVVMKLTQNRACLTNAFIVVLILPYVTREYHLKVLELIYLLRYTAAHWLGFLERHNASVFSLLGLISGRWHPAANRSSACWGSVQRMQAVANRPQKAIGWVSIFQQWHPRPWLWLSVQLV